MNSLNMKKKKLILYSLLLLFLSLIFAGIIGAIIRLINIPAIIITLLCLGGIISQKRFDWWERFISSNLNIISNKKNPNYIPSTKKKAASESLKSIDQLINLINDKVTSKALREEKERVSLELTRGDIVLVVFGIGSSGKTSLIRALLKKIVGNVSASMGSTKYQKNYRLRLKGLNRGIKIVDTPGILEAGKIGRKRENRALLEAGNADLILVVVEGDLRATEINTIRNLSIVGKRLIIVLNKIDLRGENEERKLVKILNNRCNDFLKSEDIVCTSASPQTIAISGKKPYQPSPEINSLIKRLANILHEEGEELIADNILLQCRSLDSQGKNILNNQRNKKARRCVDRYGWISSGVLLVTPLPMVDMLAAAAVNAQMVIEIAKIYGVDLTKERARNLALSVGKSLAALGIVKGGVSLVTASLNLALPSLLVSKVIQSISISWLTRVAGASFITYFKQNQNWGDGGIQEVVQYHYNLNKRDEHFKSFIKKAYERVIDPLTQKKLKKLPPRSRPPKEGEALGL